LIDRHSLNQTPKAAVVISMSSHDEMLDILETREFANGCVTSLEELLEWKAEAAQLVNELDTVHLLHRIDVPSIGAWQSKNGLENHQIYAWSGNAYSPELHFQRLYDRIGEAISADRRIWQYQAPFFSQAFGKFFTPEFPYLLNAIFVTPTRVPMKYWPAAGRQPIEQSREPCDRQLSDRQNGIPFTFTELSVPLKLRLEDIAWADFALQRVASPQLASMWTLRSWGRWYFPVQRIFQADFSGPDMLALEAGAIPALRDPRVTGTRPGRVDLSMFQLFRLKHDGEGDLLFFEVMHRSGLMVDIRASRQELGSVVMPDPYFGPAIRRAIHRGKQIHYR
jgi:hypothetical protein